MNRDQSSILVFLHVYSVCIFFCINIPYLVLKTKKWRNNYINIAVLSYNKFLSIGKISMRQ